MLNETERHQLQTLRERDEGTLSPVEAERLAHLIDRLETTEAALLAPAVQRLQYEVEVTETKNHQLRALVQREAVLAERLQSVLHESRAIAQEAARMLAQV